MADISGEQLKHMVHAEDNLYNGPEAAEHTISTLYNIYDTLKGNTPKKAVNITLKWDGCFAPSTLIKTSAGLISIFEAIQRTQAGEQLTVECFDLDSQIQVESQILNSSVKSGEKNWVRIILSNGSFITCTEDHPIYTKNRGYVPAADLTPEDELLS